VNDKDSLWYKFPSKFRQAYLIHSKNISRGSSGRYRFSKYFDSPYLKHKKIEIAISDSETLTLEDYIRAVENNPQKI